MISEVEQEWHRQNLAVQRQARDAGVAAERDRLRAGRERMEKDLRAKFAAKASAAPKVPPPPADSGPGWRVLEQPRVPHSALEEHARAVWDFTWHSIDFPAGWRVRWGQLDSALLTVAGAADYCAARQLGPAVLGLCVMSSKIVLLSEENQQGRTAKQFGTTVIHELVHVNVRNTVHGEQFQRALESATGYFFGAAAAPASPQFMAKASAPPAWWGARFGPGRDPGLEYRGEMAREEI